MTSSDADAGMKDALRRVHTVTERGISQQETISRYDTWAPDYQKDLDEYLGPTKRVAMQRILDEVLTDPTGQVLDVACGTGFLGEQIKQMGYSAIDGVDGSREMLKLAEATGAYRKLYCDFIGRNQLDIAPDTYDAVLLVGSMSPSHVTDDSYEELIRVTKPGGRIVMVTAAGLLAPSRDQYEATMRRLEADGKWTWTRTGSVSDYNRSVYEEGDQAVVHYFTKST